MFKAGSIILSALMAVTGILPASAQAAPEFTLSFNLPIPPVHTRWQGPLKSWVEEVEKRSNGRIKIEPFFAEALSPRTEAFDSVKNGIADITECAYEANSGQFPFHEGILSIPTPSRFLGNGSALVNGMYKKHPEVLKELDGVKLLLSHASGSVSIGTTNKPIRSLADLKGMKLNAQCAMIAERLKKLGVSVVTVPPSDLYTALEQGVIEGSTLSPELLVARRWGDSVKYLTDISMQNTLFYIIINEDVFKNLPEDLQKVFEEASAVMEPKFADYWLQADIAGLEKWMKKMGGKEVIQLSDADYATIDKETQAPVDEWFKMLTKKGLNGDAIRKSYYELAKQLSSTWAESDFYKSYKNLSK